MIFQKQRGERRESAAVMVRIRVDHRECDAMLDNACSRGVLAIMDDPPACGSRVKIEIGQRTLYGRIRWAHADRCGIALQEEIGVRELIEGRAVQVLAMSERDIAGAAARPILPRAIQFLMLAALLGGASYTIGRLSFGHTDRKSQEPGVSSEHRR